MSISAEYIDKEHAASFTSKVLQNMKAAILQLELTQAGKAADANPLKVTYGIDTYIIKRHVSPNGEIDFMKYDFMGKLQRPILITLHKGATKGNPFGYGGRRRRRTRRF